MTNAIQVKADVINELRNQIYYGQIEVQRLLTNAVGLSHKQVVDKIIIQLKDNLLAGEAINLIETYIPTSVQSAPDTIEKESLGIKKIE